MYMPLINELVYIPKYRTDGLIYYNHAGIIGIRYYDGTFFQWECMDYYEIEYLWIGECLHDCL